MMYPTGIFVDDDVRAATTCSTLARNSTQREAKAFAIAVVSTNGTHTLPLRYPRAPSTLRTRIQTNQRAVDRAKTKMSSLSTRRIQRTHNRPNVRAWGPMMNYLQAKALLYMHSNL